MAIHLIPSSYRCDCGHVVHLSERVVREMREEARRKPSRISDSEKVPHVVEFTKDGAVAVICPRLGRCEITGWE
jgi:hypothetical protein